MKLIDKVLTAFSLCQKGESGKCEECPYFISNNCRYQFLARDAEIVIKNLLEETNNDTLVPLFH